MQEPLSEIKSKYAKLCEEADMAKLRYFLKSKELRKIVDDDTIDSAMFDERCIKLLEEIDVMRVNIKSFSDKLSEMILIHYDNNDEKMKSIHEKYTRNRMQLWINASYYFAKMMLNYDFSSECFVDPSVNEIISRSNFTAKKKKIVLTEDKNGCIYLIDDKTDFKSSPCFALHVSDGSYYSNDSKGRDGYRHVYFLTKSGSVYWGSGVGMDKKSLELLKKLYILYN